MKAFFFVYVLSLTLAFGGEYSWARAKALLSETDGNEYWALNIEDSPLTQKLQSAYRKRMEARLLISDEEILEIAKAEHRAMKQTMSVQQMIEDREAKQAYFDKTKKLTEEQNKQAEQQKNLADAEYEKQSIIEGKLQTNAEAWALVKKEFPHLYVNGKPAAETVRWMREWDDYYKVHDPDLAKNPARPIYYARMNAKQEREANAAARQAAVELYESSGQRAIDEMKADLTKQAEINAAQARAELQAAQESNRRQQAELAAQAAEFQRQQQLNMQQQQDEMRWKMEELERQANPNRYKGYTTR